MAFVLDAPVAASWAFQDETHPAADLAFLRIRTEEACVPSLWWFEIRNILAVNERRGRISESDSINFLRELGRLPIRLDRSPEENGVMRLARNHRLSVYDACYLELAQRERVPLATLDNELARAAQAEGVCLIAERS